MLTSQGLIGFMCAFAITRPEGTLYWIDGIFEGENETHYFFNVKGKTHAMLRTSIMRIEAKYRVSPAQPPTGSEERRS